MNRQAEIAIGGRQPGKVPTASCAVIGWPKEAKPLLFLRIGLFNGAAGLLDKGAAIFPIALENSRLVLRIGQIRNMHALNGDVTRNINGEINRAVLPPRNLKRLTTQEKAKASLPLANR